LLLPAILYDKHCDFEESGKQTANKRTERKMRNVRRFGRAATLLAVASFVALPVLAADAPASGAGPGQSSDALDARKVKELEDKVNQRDLIIRDLLRRVESLEHAQSPSSSTGSAPGSAGQQPSLNAALPVSGAALPPMNQASPAPPANSPSMPAGQAAMTPNPNMNPTPQNAPQTGSEPAMSGPGEFVVSEEDAKRALERALVQTGAALLPTGKVEFVPSLTYSFRREAFPGQIALTTTGTVFITETVTRQTAIEGGALVRVGLPFGTQAEVSLPWDYKNVQTATNVNGAGLSEHAVEVQGLGDPVFTLTKQVFTEEGLRPSVFAGATWNSNFGQVKSGLPLGTGFNEFSAGVTAVKRQDPLVFTAGLGYQYTEEHNNYKPGDQFTPSVGLFLAVSPETSIRFSQQITFAGSDEFNGQRIPGSEKTAGIFSFGLLSILGRGFIVNVTGGIGETHDAPDFFLQVGFPIRLN
jgi:hypothetical protein